MKDLSTIEFVGGPHCGKERRVGRVWPRYEWEDGMGTAHEYLTEPSLKREGVFLAIHAGVVAVR